MEFLPTFHDLSINGGLQLFLATFAYMTSHGFDITIGTFHYVLSYSSILIGSICYEIGTSWLRKLFEW